MRQTVWHKNQLLFDRTNQKSRQAQCRHLAKPCKNDWVRLVIPIYKAL